MKQSLQLKLGQQLTMTPQLQQAIRLLQLSTMDLQQEIQQALDSNPMLEVEEEHDSDDHFNTGDERSSTVEPATSDRSLDNLERTPSDLPGDDVDWAENLPDDAPVDTQWDDLLPAASASSYSGDDLSDYGLDSRNAASDSLRDQLMWQLSLTRLSDVDRLIALAIIDATDENGRVIQDLDEMRQSLADEMEVDIELDEMIAVLHRLQQFEPAGVCTRDLQECLLVQLQQMPPSTPWLEQARLVLTRHINQLGNGDYAQILRRTRLQESDLKQVLLLIQSLDPNPGQSVAQDNTEYVVPDVFVSKKEGRWVVELNPDIAPKLRINSNYAGLIKRADSSADNTYLRDNLQEARWFLKSLHSRNETLMKVATRIVEHQRNFLEYGAEAMKPLVLHEIAALVEMHESTISRVTTQKYMHTPRGVFELKYFFSSHVATTSGGECSSTAIRALIRKLVAAENPRKPLSDNKITSLLEEQGVKVARRTIAKYRESLMIPPSNERKRLV